MPGRMSGFSGLRAVLSLVAGPALRACALSYPWPQVRVFRLARCPIPDGMSGFSGLRAVLSLCGAIAGGLGNAELRQAAAAHHSAKSPSMFAVK